MAPHRDRQGTAWTRGLRVLRRSGTIAVLNVLAVGASLAACTGDILCGFGGVAPVVFPTFVAGMGWATLMRWEKRAGSTNVRWGWLLSVPIAYLNCAVAVCLVMGEEPLISARLPMCFFIAALGVVVWLPALLATLVCFGVPIAWAQRLARQGLAGAERGELVVGTVSLLLAVLAWLVGPVGAALGLPAIPPSAAEGRVMLSAFACLGALAGGAAAGLARIRERRRSAFVAKAEAGEIPGYRVQPTEDGKVLLRVTSMGEGYRVAEIEEELHLETASGARAWLR